MNFVNFRHCNFFFVLAKNKRKFEEQATEELYTSSFEEISENGSIADEIIQQYIKEELRCLTTKLILFKNE